MIKKQTLWVIGGALFSCMVGCQSAPEKAAKDNELLVYADPAAPLTLQVGDEHPTQEGWKFFTAHEFNPDKVDSMGTPLGFEPQNKWFQDYASIDNGLCMKVSPEGVVSLLTIQHPDSVVNSFGNKVVYSTYSAQTVPPTHSDYWGNFAENMRYEVRMRCSDEVGFNHALWFMPERSRESQRGGATYEGWPACGEIDLMETPRAEPNQTTWFTLHSEHYYAGGQNKGVNGSTYKTVDMADMRQWNIYWVELSADSIVGGVNGDRFFSHVRGANGNLDWPWNKSSWYFIVTPGVSNDPTSWMGAIKPEQWDPKRPPIMELDWVRVYTNDAYTGEQPVRKFY